ncbi:hypothetical protein PoB_005440900 [Plakobranchus ocellatus]|uniref:Uncharacterized protein n=1 Tax=Plakobranchus ocellatus TaxID=259542 RepID=A0AAV4C5T0_9GAST|nr:hypothetical protein PoB_005440900 [Plakobranchus ocellatus]
MLDANNERVATFESLDLLGTDEDGWGFADLNFEAIMSPSSAIPGIPFDDIGFQISNSSPLTATWVEINDFEIRYHFVVGVVRIPRVRQNWLRTL